MVAAYEDSFMYVGTRRNGVGAFLVQLFGYKKVYKVKNQLLVDYSLRRALDSNGVAIEPMPLKRKRRRLRRAINHYHIGSTSHK